MDIVEVQSRVGPDGVLSLSVPVGSENANREVTVTIAGVSAPASQKPSNQREWKAFLDRTAASIDDPTFARPPQGDFEQRPELFP